MGHMEDEVRELILDRNRSLAAFAREIGISEQTLYSVLNNGLAGATLATVVPIVTALGLDPIEISRGNIVETSPAQGAVDVPLFGTVSAGRPADPDRADTTFPIPATLHEAHPRAFLLRVEGESMNRVIANGSYALVDPCDSVDASGQIYAVAVGETAATVKRVRLLANGLELQPDSDDPTFRLMVFDKADEDAPTVTVIGRVVWFCPPLDWQSARQP